MTSGCFVVFSLEYQEDVIFLMQKLDIAYSKMLFPSLSSVEYNAML